MNALLRILNRFLEDVTRSGFGAVDIDEDTPIGFSNGQSWCKMR